MHPWYSPLLACVNFHAKETCHRKPLDRRCNRTRHTDRIILRKDVQSRSVNLDVELDFFLGPEVTELTA